MGRFIHTSDWHLGMRARFLPEEARARFLQARFDAVARIADLAREEQVDFVVVAGDVFDHNLVDRRIVSQAIEVLKEFTVPVFLLPANHDPLDPASVYGSERWQADAPAGVTVLDGDAIHTVAGIEIYGLPWTSKRPLSDPVAEAYAASPRLLPRVVVGHGAIDELSPDRDDPSLISAAELRRALDERRATYVALGDRHSVTEIASCAGRAWYSGSPLATDYGEAAPNQVLLVSLEGAELTVVPRRVGEWAFIRERRDLAGSEDIAALARWLEGMAAKRTTAVKLALVGTLSLAQSAELEDLLDRHSDTFAALNRWERHSDLAVVPDAADLESLELSGYAQAALAELDALATSNGDVAARDALNLLYRLAR